jgi:23S rRNA G2445 N2-methylase RlmL
MARSRTTPALPACYALVQPGLEEVAAEEIQQELGGEVKRTSRGVVVFRVEEIDDSLLRMRTTEDVFLLAWGTDDLTYRAEDLERIQKWTARQADWNHLLRLHHAMRPLKGRPTYHLVSQMEGHHGYRRRDARKALAEGLAGKIPTSWLEVEENAALEVWLSIDNATAVCGVRLSDRSMRHRTWKLEHRPASLRPTIAAAIVRLGEVRPGQVVLDPMCGAGTILAEFLDATRKQHGRVPPLGGDIEMGAVRAARVNVRHLGLAHTLHWDARRLPLGDDSIDRIMSNPPFGKQLESPESIGPLYRAVIQEWDRVLRPGGRAVLLVGDIGALRAATKAVGWNSLRQLPIRVLGQPAMLTVWQKRPA